MTGSSPPPPPQKIIPGERKSPVSRVSVEAAVFQALLQLLGVHESA